MTMHRCTDGLGPAKKIEAENATEAARLYVGPSKAWRDNGYDENAVEVFVSWWEGDEEDNETVEVTLDDVYLVGDQCSGQMTIRADSPDDAIDEYLDGGDWTPEEGGTVWYTITAYDRDGERTERKVEFNPPEPKCAEGHDHDWQSPHEIVGGLEENPGVSGHGGGVITHEVCAHCGLHRWTDTWATDPSDGEQGLTSVEYGRDYEEEE